jgi:endonuclease/exonuclease/phosphatase family metal-dependent hydrolase
VWRVASIHVLSWNVQKFGKPKLGDQNFIRYVSRVITEAGADVVGIMEVVGWIGNELGTDSRG